MSGMCSIFVVGRLGKDPRSVALRNGTPASDFSVAYDEGYGENKKTLWINCVAFNKTADVCNRYLHKGSVVSIIGRLSEDEWTDKNGQTRKSPKVVIDRIEMMDQRQAGSNNDQYGQSAPGGYGQSTGYGQQAGYGQPQQSYGQYGQASSSNPPPFTPPSQQNTASTEDAPF